MTKFIFHRKRIGIVLALLFFSTFLVFTFRKLVFPSYERRRIDLDRPLKVKVLHSDKDGGKQQSKEKKSRDWLKNQKCNIPKLDINGKEIIHFFEKHAPLECQLNKDVEPDWVTVDESGVIRISEGRKSAKCTMQYFWMKTENENEYGETIRVEDGTKFTQSDFASVTCWQGFSKWSTLLWHTVRNEKAHRRARAKNKTIEFLGAVSVRLTTAFINDMKVCSSANSRLACNSVQLNT